MELWPEADGFYTIDDSLEPSYECGNRPIYRQVNGTGFLWADGDDNWYHTTVLCDSSWATAQFYAYTETTADDNSYSYYYYYSYCDSPDDLLVTDITYPSEVECWVMTTRARHGIKSSGLHVSDAPAESCGRKNVIF